MAPGATVLVLNGACGNVCQVDPRNPATHEVGLSHARAMGEVLAAAADVATRRPASRRAGGPPAVRAESPLRIAVERLTVSRRTPDRTVLRWALGEAARPRGDALPALSDYGVEPHGTLPAGTLSLADLFATRAWLAMEAREILAAAEEAQRSPTVDIALSVLALGDLALVCVPGELFAEYGLRIRQESPYPLTLVAELVNGWVGYLPTPKAFSRPGGYETKFISTSSLAEDAGELVASRAVRMLRAARGGAERHAPPPGSHARE